MKVKKILISLFLLLALLSMVFLKRPTKSIDEEKNKIETKNPSETSNISNSRLVSTSQSGELHLKSEILQTKWTEYFKNPQKINLYNNNQYYKLINETIDELKCSKEMVELLHYMGEHKTGEFNMAFAAKNISVTIGTKLRKFPNSDEMRELLLSVPNNKNFNNENYLLLWSKSAGEGCPPDKFDNFLNQLPDENTKQEAQIGFSEKYVETDPVAGVQMVLDCMNSKITTKSQDYALCNAMKYLPNNAPFDKIEQMFPKADINDIMSPINAAKVVLFGKWADSDPAAAANYIIEHPQAIKPSNVHKIVSVVMAKNRESGFLWAQKFPEGTVYYDYAISAAASYVGDEWIKEAKELALQISDKKIKEETLKTMEEKIQRFYHSKGN